MVRSLAQIYMPCLMRSFLFWEITNVRLKTSYNGHRVGPFVLNGTFPCLGIGSMNQPLIIYDTKLQGLIGLCLEEFFLWFCKTNLTTLWPGRSESTKKIGVWTR